VLERVATASAAMKWYQQSHLRGATLSEHRARKERQCTALDTALNTALDDDAFIFSC
jgi:hypothetical protein